MNLLVDLNLFADLNEPTRRLESVRRLESIRTGIYSQTSIYSHLNLLADFNLYADFNLFTDLNESIRRLESTLSLLIKGQSHSDRFTLVLGSFQVVQATMIRDRQHGPVVELNRIALRRSRATGKQTVGVNATVFAQMANKLSLLSYDVLMLPHRTWKVKFVGNSLHFEYFIKKFVITFYLHF